MLCLNCGSEANGRFCSSCGAKLVSHEDVVADYTSYKQVMADPKCQEMIASHAAKAKGECLSAAEFLNIAQTIMPVSIPLETVGKVGSKLGAALGIKTTQARQMHLPYSFGYVLLGTICTLARHSMKIQSVSETPQSCTVEAVLPSSMWAWQGTIRLAVVSDETGTKLIAETKVPGQLYDWGKSKRTIETLLSEINSNCATFEASGF
jgi:hypothetical protein